MSLDSPLPSQETIDVRQQYLREWQTVPTTEYLSDQTLVESTVGSCGFGCSSSDAGDDVESIQRQSVPDAGLENLDMHNQPAIVEAMIRPFFGTGDSSQFSSEFDESTVSSYESTAAPTRRSARLQERDARSGRSTVDSDSSAGGSGASRNGSPAPAANASVWLSSQEEQLRQLWDQAQNMRPQMIKISAVYAFPQQQQQQQQQVSPGSDLASMAQANPFLFGNWSNQNNGPPRMMLPSAPTSPRQR